MHGLRELLSFSCWRHRWPSSFYSKVVTRTSINGTILMSFRSSVCDVVLRGIGINCRWNSHWAFHKREFPYECILHAFMHFSRLFCVFHWDAPFSSESLQPSWELEDATRCSKLQEDKFSYRSIPILGKKKSTNQPKKKTQPNPPH